MKKLYATLACAAVICLLILSTPHAAFTDDVSPQAGKTGAPSEGTCANSGCHTGSSGGTGNIAMTFSGGNAYTPGTTYDVTVTVTDTNAVRFGFELTALDPTNAKAGNLAVTNTTNQSTPTAGGVSGRQYIAHKNANANNTWTFQWTAPATAIGDVTFYYSGNGANGNNHATGDKIYLGSTTISINTAVQLTGRNDAMFHVQSPAANELYVNYSLNEPADVISDLYDITGQKILALENMHAAAGNHAFTAPLYGIAKGLYIVRFSANNRVQTSKIIVM